MAPGDRELPGMPGEAVPPTPCMIALADMFGGSCTFTRRMLEVPPVAQVEFCCGDLSGQRCAVPVTTPAATIVNSPEELLSWVRSALAKKIFDTFIFIVSSDTFSLEFR